jgi:hypothetical protein
VIEDRERIRKLRAKDPSKRNEIEGQLDELRGTYAADQAGQYFDQLRAKLDQ